jgi:type I site-specific restriction-modification system R (restriction) subunit
LSQSEIDAFIQEIFEELEKMEGEKKETADRIMNLILYWRVKNKNKSIIQNLERVILGKRTPLSITAMKCIKTFIQMANLRDEKEWEDVEQTLLKIIKSTLV